MVPDQDSLVVEAQIGVDDISDVHPNARAEVHLTAYKQRFIPIVHGDVIQVSANRLTDPKSGNPYAGRRAGTRCASQHPALSRHARAGHDSDHRTHRRRRQPLTSEKVCPNSATTASPLSGELKGG